SVLFLGDMFVNGHIGYLAEAHFIPWIKALDQMIALNPKVVVPGHGALGGGEDLKFFRQYLDDSSSSAQAHFDQKNSIEGYELPEKYKSLGSQFFLQENLERAFELWQSGTLRPDHAKGRCAL